MAAVAHLAAAPRAPAADAARRLHARRGDRRGRDAVRHRALRRDAAPTRSTASQPGELQDETFSAVEVLVTFTASTSTRACATGKLVNAARLAGAVPRRAARRPAHAGDDRRPRRLRPPLRRRGRRRPRRRSALIARDFDDDLLDRARRARAPRPPRRSRSRAAGALDVEVTPQYPNMRTLLDAVPGGRRARRAGDPRRGDRGRPRRRSAAAPTARCSARAACRRRTCSPAATSTTRVREWASVQDMASAAAVIVRLAEAWARLAAPVCAGFALDHRRRPSARTRGRGRRGAGERRELSFGPALAPIRAKPLSSTERPRAR